MSRRIIVVSGPVSSGKTSLVTGLAERFGFMVLRTRGLISARSKQSTTERLLLQNAGDRLDRTTSGRWVLNGVIELSKQCPDKSIVIDSVRTKEQIERIRAAFGTAVTHIHLTAPLEILERRYQRKYRPQNSTEPSYQQVRANTTEQRIESLKDGADIVINTQRCNESDVLIQAMGRLKLFDGEPKRTVDVLVGGQYGSEGKGQIAAYLAGEYDLLIRVGGPNAGHKVFEHPEPYTHHQLPSGTRRNLNAKLLVAPGAVIRVELLLKEIADCGVDSARLSIDPAAMVISDDDISKEEELKASIGSTGQGVGAATARRIWRDATTVRAKEVPELRPYMREAVDILEEAYAYERRIMVEGTQGTGLSLYHGAYPYVTSRDTTISGCLSEAGIAPSRVRRSIMVCRTFPIRVQNPQGGTSGPMSIEIPFTEIAHRSGQNVKRLREAERTSTTNRERRIGEFDWVLLRKAALLNGPTDIALTFTDYLAPMNKKAMRFDQLDPLTIDFIEQVEQVTCATVSLITTGFNTRSIIDRRTW